MNDISIDIKKIKITKKTTELVKLKMKLPANATDEEILRATHIFFIDCFIKILRNSKKYWEAERIDTMLSVIDIVDTNSLIDAINNTSNYGDKLFDMIDSMASHNKKALKTVLTDEEWEDTYFNG